MGKAHFPLMTVLDHCKAEKGTLTIDRGTGIVTIRPYRRRRTYELTVDAAATILVRACCQLEARNNQKRRRRRSIKRGKLA